MIRDPFHIYPQDLCRAAAQWLLALSVLALAFVASAQPIDPLPSWQDSVARANIIAFVKAVTTTGSKDFVPPAQRIAVFDNDGTLWGEQPMYVQGFFMMDRVKALAPEHPEWKTREPFASVLRGDVKGALAGGDKSLIQLAMATHAGMSTEEFEQIAADWIATARHPKTGRLFTDMVYQPMLEVLEFLRANGFKTYIVSGGSVEFMRPWTERIYGIPPEQVVGSTIKTRFEMRNGTPTIMRLPQVDFIDDKSGKPVGINAQIGRRPIAAFGNSDGDLQMLQWTTSGAGARLGVIIHHTDAAREYAYDRTSSTGRLDLALDQAAARGWTVVDMKSDWKTIYPAPSAATGTSTGPCVLAQCAAAGSR